MQGEVQGKQAAVRNLEEEVHGTQWATWSEGILLVEARGRRVIFYLSIMILFFLSQNHCTYWEFSPNFTNTFGSGVPNLLIVLGLKYQLYY